jgi:hypothetical protein
MDGKATTITAARSCHGPRMYTVEAGKIIRAITMLAHTLGAGVLHTLQDLVVERLQSEITTVQSMLLVRHHAR